MRIECLLGSTLPDELRAAGYDVSRIGEGERILPTATVEKFVAGAGGALVPMTEGSTRPVAETRTMPVLPGSNASASRLPIRTADVCLRG